MCIDIFANPYVSICSVHSNHAGIVELPRLIIGPTDAIGVKEHDSVEFECHFTGSLIPHLANCEWLKDGHSTSNENKHQTIDPTSNNIICSYIITSVSSHDEGNYDCYIYYNKCFGDQFNFPKDEIIKSESEGAVLQLAGKINNCMYWYVAMCFISGTHDKLEIIATATFVIVVIACVIGAFLCKYWHVCRKNPGNHFLYYDYSNAKRFKIIW